MNDLDLNRKKPTPKCEHLPSACSFLILIKITVICHHQIPFNVLLCEMVQIQMENGVDVQSSTPLIKHTHSEFRTSHSYLSKTEQTLYYRVQSWHHMECGCGPETESSGTHLSCWAQMHCSPPTLCDSQLHCTQSHRHSRKIHTCRRACMCAHELPLPMWCRPVTNADPHQGWQLLSGWCHERGGGRS